jgi:hypothetical protein
MVSLGMQLLYIHSILMRIYLIVRLVHSLRPSLSSARVFRLQVLAWVHGHGFSWYAAIIHPFYFYEDLSNRPARSLVASVTIISSYPSTDRISLHFHAGSHFSCPSNWRRGFRIVLCVLPRLVYPSSYSSQYGTSSSRRKAHISA